MRASTSAPVVEVGRLHETSSLAAGDTTAGELDRRDESIFPESDLENTSVQLNFDEEITISSPTPARDRSQPAANMSGDMSNILQDPLLYQLAQLLSETKHRKPALKKKAREGETSLHLAQEVHTTIRQSIENDTAVEVTTTVNVLDKGHQRARSRSHSRKSTVRVPDSPTKTSITAWRRRPDQLPTTQTHRQRVRHR